MVLSNKIDTSKSLSKCFWIILFTVCIATLIQLQTVYAVTPDAGIIIPLYSNPGPTWDQLVKEKNTHPSVPIIAIINPDNGPGKQDPGYAMGIQKLQSAGITVLGYVYTNYGTRSITSIENDINSYNNWYHVNGINFDEMANKDGFQSYYSDLSSYAKSLGMTMTVGNPGTDTLPSYVGTVDTMILYDNQGLPSMSYLGGWHSNYTKTNFSVISYGINSMNSTYVTNATQYVQYLYLTNSTLPNPFLTLPNYLDNLIGVLENISNQNNGIAVSTTAKPSSYQDQKTNTLEINLRSVTGERADYHGTSLKIYQDNANTPFEVIGSISGNPYGISLPVGHTYKIEVYVSGMLASTGYANLEGDSKKLDLGMPNPGSFRITAVYKDGYTPVDNATVMIKSMDGTYAYWTNSTTDKSGNTIRFWLQPTISNDDYYVATVILGNGLLYSYHPIFVSPGLSNNIQINTPWPAVLPPITVSVYKSSFQKVSKSDGSFIVQLYNDKGSKVAESGVNVIGQATFPSLKVGRYIFNVVNLNGTNDMKWNPVNMILDGKQTSVQIFKNTNQTDYENMTDTSVKIGNDPVSDPPLSQGKIPLWVKINIQGWAQNQVKDSSFVDGIKYLVEEGILKMPPTQISLDPTSEQIPSWFKSTATWWSQGQIPDDDFINGIQWLISAGVITI